RPSAGELGKCGSQRWVCGEVSDMHQLSCFEQSCKMVLRPRMNHGLVLSLIPECDWSTVHCDDAKIIALVQHQRPTGGFAKTSRVLQHGLEHRLQLARRTRNDLKYLSGGRLLLQRLAQFVQQPRVLDGDDGLGGEALH